MTPDPQAAPLSAEELERYRKIIIAVAWSIEDSKFYNDCRTNYGARMLATITALQGELAEAKNAINYAENIQANAANYIDELKARAEAAESALTAERKAKASPHGGMTRKKIVRALELVPSITKFSSVEKFHEAQAEAIFALIHRDLTAEKGK